MAIAALIQEIDTLEAQIAAAQARLEQLKNVEKIASSAIATVQAAVSAVESTAPSALDSLRDLVLSFFPTPTETKEKPPTQLSDDGLEDIAESGFTFYPDEEPEAEVGYLKEPVEDGDIY